MRPEHARGLIEKQRVDRQSSWIRAQPAGTLMLMSSAHDNGFPKGWYLYERQSGDVIQCIASDSMSETGVALLTKGSNTVSGQWVESLQARALPSHFTEAIGMAMIMDPDSLRALLRGELLLLNPRFEEALP